MCEISYIHYVLCRHQVQAPPSRCYKYLARPREHCLQFIFQGKSEEPCPICRENSSLKPPNSPKNSESDLYFNQESSLVSSSRSIFSNSKNLLKLSRTSSDASASQASKWGIRRKLRSLLGRESRQHLDGDFEGAVSTPESRGNFEQSVFLAPNPLSSEPLSEKRQSGQSGYSAEETLSSATSHHGNSKLSARTSITESTCSPRSSRERNLNDTFGHFNICRSSQYNDRHIEKQSSAKFAGIPKRHQIPSWPLTSIDVTIENEQILREASSWPLKSSNLTVKSQVNTKSVDKFPLLHGVPQVARKDIVFRNRGVTDGPDFPTLPAELKSRASCNQQTHREALDKSIEIEQQRMRQLIPPGADEAETLGKMWADIIDAHPRTLSYTEGDLESLADEDWHTIAENEWRRLLRFL